MIWHYRVERHLPPIARCGIRNWLALTSSKRGVTCKRCRRLLKLTNLEREGVSGMTDTPDLGARKPEPTSAIKPVDADTEAKLRAYETRLGHLLQRALRKGGIDLVNTVDACAGPCRRHIQRVRARLLGLSERIEGEITQSLDYAEKHLENWTA
jgi:hypothetical protein